MVVSGRVIIFIYKISKRHFQTVSLHNEGTTYNFIILGNHRLHSQASDRRQKDVLGALPADRFTTANCNSNESSV